jgi:hypothetical protein
MTPTDDLRFFTKPSVSVIKICVMFFRSEIFGSGKDRKSGLSVSTKIGIFYFLDLDIDLANLKC